MRLSLMMVACPVTVVALLCTTCTAEQHQKRLLDDLLLSKNYDINVIPASRRGHNLTVNFQFGLHQVLSLDIESGKMHTRCLTRTWWRDPQLMWNPEDYGGIDKVFLPADKVFTPQIVLSNAIEIKGITDVKVVVSYNGDVVWFRPETYMTTCTHRFRGDSWNCPFRFRSWIYAGDLVDLRPHMDFNDIDMTEYEPSAFWSVLTATGQRVVKNYMWDQVGFPTLDYTLSVRNKIGHLVGKRSVPEPPEWELQEAEIPV